MHLEGRLDGTSVGCSVSDPKAREQEAKVEELAKCLFVASRSAQYEDDWMSPKEAFEAAERFIRISEQRWEALK
jgi:hypothetical protein